MDFEAFAQASVAGVPLVIVIVGLVAYAKGFKRPDGQPVFSGNGLLGVSMGIGLLFGGLYMLTQTRPPAADWWVQLGYWFALGVYGIVMGLVASGLYDTAKGIGTKLFGDLLKKLVAKTVERP